MSPLSSVLSFSSESSADGDVIQERDLQERVGAQTTEDVSAHCPERGHEWQGFKIVGDNIDKTVHSRHQTIDSPTQSLHYFNLTVMLFKIASTRHPTQIRHLLSTLKQSPWTFSCQPKMVVESSIRALQSILLGC